MSRTNAKYNAKDTPFKLQLNPAITDVKRPTNVIRYRRIADIEIKRN